MEWTQENNLHILEVDHLNDRYVIDFEKKDIYKQFRLMGEWEEANFVFNVFPPTLEQAKELVETDIKNQEIAEKVIKHLKQ